MMAATSRKKKITPELKGMCRLFTKKRSNLPERFTTCGTTPQRMKPSNATDTISERVTPHSALEVSAPFLPQRMSNGVVTKSQIRTIHIGEQKMLNAKDISAKASTAPMPVAFGERR